MTTIKAGPNHPAFRGAAGEKMRGAVAQYDGCPIGGAEEAQVRETIAHYRPSWGNDPVYPDLAKWGVVADYATGRYRVKP